MATKSESLFFQLFRSLLLFFFLFVFIKAHKPMRPYSTIEHTKQWIRTREQNANIRNISARRALNRRIQLLRGGSRKDSEKKNIYGKTLEPCPAG
jgi:hypothetical protein